MICVLMPNSPATSSEGNTVNRLTATQKTVYELLDFRQCLGGRGGERKKKETTKQN